MTERTRHKIILTLRDHIAQREFDPWDTDEPMIVGSHALPSGIGAGFLPHDAPSRSGPVCAQYWPDRTGGKGTRPIEAYIPRGQDGPLHEFGGWGWEIPCELNYFGRLESDGVPAGQTIPIRNMDLQADKKYAPCELVGDDPYPPTLPQGGGSAPPGLTSSYPIPPGIGGAGAVSSFAGSLAASFAPSPQVSSQPKKSPLSGQYDEHNERPQARSVASPLPYPMRAIRVAGTEKGEQHPLVVPAWANVLIADHRSEQADALTFSTRVAELELDPLTGRTQLDETRRPTLSSVFAAKKAQEPGPLATAGVCLTLGNVPSSDDIGGGFFYTDGWLGTLGLISDASIQTSQGSPGGNTTIGAGRAFANASIERIKADETGNIGLSFMGETFGGPVSCGAGLADKHRLWTNGDGEPGTCGHHQLLAPWIVGNSSLYDAPPEVDLQLYEQAGHAGVWWQTRLRLDPLSTHDSIVGVRDGLFRWETKIPILGIEIPDPFPPRVDPPPDGDPFPPKEPKPPKGPKIPPPGAPLVPPKPPGVEPRDGDLMGPGLPDAPGSFASQTPVHGSWAQPAQVDNQVRGIKQNIGALVHIWQEIATTGLAFQPSLPIPGRDVRHVQNPTIEQQERDIRGGPITLRLEPFGAVSGGKFVESNKPAMGNLYAKPTVAGGVGFVPAERDSFGSNTRGTVPTRYVYLYEDDVRLAWGTPLATGLIGSGWLQYISGTTLRMRQTDATGAVGLGFNFDVTAGVPTLTAGSFTDTNGASSFIAPILKGPVSAPAKNTTGATLTAPIVVTETGYAPGDTAVEVAAVSALANKAAGIVLVDIAAGAVGKMAISGPTVAIGLDTSASAIGASVYSSAVGALTLTPGGPRVARVLTLANPGYIYVDVAQMDIGQSGAAVGFSGATPVAIDTGWSITNPTTRRTFDVAAGTLAELREFVGTMAQKMGLDVGLIKA